MLDPHEALHKELSDRYELEKVLGEGGMGTVYYVMPFVEGESLRQRLDGEGRLLLEEEATLRQGIYAGPRLS